jgi:hypothetical protein
MHKRNKKPIHHRMSSKTGNGNSAVVSAAAGVQNAAAGVQNAAASATQTVSSWVGSPIASTTGMIVCGLLAVGLYIGSFLVISQFVGTKDSQNQIKPEINKILGLTIGGSFALFLALLLYFIKDPGSIIYIVLIITCITLAISYSSLAVAAISK